MPTYQYACTECGERLEAVQSFADPALTECPNCAGKLRKVFNSVGIVFKGSGFYRNDSRSGNTSAEKAEKGEKGEKAAPAATETKSDSSSSTTSTPSTPAAAGSGSSSNGSSSSTATSTTKTAASSS